MATTRIHLNGPIAGLDRHFNGYELAELTLLAQELSKGRARTEKDTVMPEGYKEDITRAVEILKASANYSYIDVNGGVESVAGTPAQGWNRVLRVEETDNPLHRVVNELQLAAEFLTLDDFDLASIDVNDYQIGVDGRQFYTPNGAVSALEVRS